CRLPEKHFAAKNRGSHQQYLSARRIPPKICDRRKFQRNDQRFWTKRVYARDFKFKFKLKKLVMKTAFFFILAFSFSFPFSRSAQTKDPRYQPKEYVEIAHPEWSKNATIYEANIRQFTPEGTFKAFESH